MCSNYLCKLIKLIWLTLPGISYGVLTRTAHLENVLSCTYLMLLEVLGQLNFFLPSEAACSLSLHYTQKLLEI